MRRELRRHPVEAKPAKGSNRPVRMPRTAASRVGAAGTATRSRVRGLPAFLQPAWFHEIFGELKKVQWPTRQETANLTLVVVVVAAALGLFLGGLDAAFNWIIENTLLR
jgi:preprotein translocase SecE subunit